VTAPSTSVADPPAPAAPAVAGRASRWRALARRDWLVVRSYRAALVSDLVFGFLNLVVYYFISRALRPGLHADLDGAPSYFAFAAGGLVLALVLQAATIGLTRRTREEQLTGTLEMLVAQPVSASDLAVGMAGFPFMFSVLRAFLYLLLAGALLGLSFAHTSWLGLVVAFVASGVAFSAIGIALGALALVFKRADTLGAAGVFALSLLGGSVFPRAVLPAGLRWLSNIVPTRFAFDALRGALFGREGWIGPSLVLLAIAVVAIPIAIALYDLALRHTIRRGTLNQY